MEFDAEMTTLHGPDWDCIEVGGGTESVLGFDPIELRGKSLYDFVHPDDMTRLVLAQRYAEEACPFEISLRAARADGEFTWVRCHVSRDGQRFELRTHRISEPEWVARLGKAHHARVDEVQRVLVGEQIRTVFQPLVNLETRKVVAYEALSRFPGDPARTPDIWFADAWALGLGIPLELLAIRTAVTALEGMPGDTRISVNASPLTIASAGFLDSLGGHGERITVELTEHLAIADYRAFRRATEPLRAAGVRLAIDDFGAGFASLKHVLKVEPDGIKLDISLTEGITESNVAHALATALLSFAEQIGVDVIAEGIETEEELDALTEIGVRFGQGFHFGVPAPAEEALLLVPA